MEQNRFFAEVTAIDLQLFLVAADECEASDFALLAIKHSELPFALIFDLDPGPADNTDSVFLMPHYGMFRDSVFWLRDSIRSGTDQSIPTRCNGLSTNPVVCR